MNNTTVLVGTVAADPPPRVTPTGTPVASFRLASTPRLFDREKEEWKDGDTVWMTVTAWRTLATNVCASLKKGDQVVVVGRLRQRTYVTPDGVERTVTEMEADAIGLELSRHAAASKRRPKADGTVDAPDDVPADVTHELDPLTGELRPIVQAPDDAAALDGELAAV